MPETDAVSAKTEIKRAPAADASSEARQRALVVLLVRHGETAWNAEGRLQGQTDVPLSPAGREQARLLGERLARAWSAAGRSSLPGPPDVVYTSDLSRAAETADIALSLGLEGIGGVRPPIHRLPELRERSFGKFEGLTAAEARARFPGETHHRAGETYAEVEQRMAAALRRAWEECTRPENDDRCGLALVAGHGGSLRLLLSRAVGLGPDGTQHFHLDNTGLSVLEFRGPTLDAAHGRILLLNDTAHLNG